MLLQLAYKLLAAERPARVGAPPQQQNLIRRLRNARHGFCST